MPPGRKFRKREMSASEALGKTFENVEGIVCNRVGKKFSCELDIGSGDEIVNIEGITHVDFEGRAEISASYLQNPRRTEILIEDPDRPLRCTVVKKHGRSGEPMRKVLDCKPM